MQKEKLDLALSVILVSLFVLLLIASGMLLFRIYLKRKNKLLLEKDRMAVQFEQTLLRSKLEMQEETFNYIAKEIHDNIGQVLSLVRINLNTVTVENLETKVELMDELMGKAIIDLRNLSHSLDTELISNTGWTKAVERLFTDLSKSGAFEVSFRVEEKLPFMPADKQIILFRMIQELINNIIRHSEAERINFLAGSSSEKLIIRMEDNGKGFDPETVKRGAGLENLKNRAILIGAGINLESNPGRGTTVTITINPN